MICRGPFSARLLACSEAAGCSADGAAAALAAAVAATWPLGRAAGAAPAAAAQRQAGERGDAPSARRRAFASSASPSASSSSASGGGGDDDGGDSAAAAAGPGPAGPSGGGGAADEPAWRAFFERPGRRRARPGAWRERMPFKGDAVGRWGALLQERDPARFERMRLVLGFYDLPENAHLPKPPLVASVAVNNLQTLFFTRDIDPYYKLALLSYRTKQANRDHVAGPLARTAALLDRLEAEAGAFAPAVPGGGDGGGGDGEGEGR